MGDKQKFSAVYAQCVATTLMANMKDHCERIEVAGSLRRGKLNVGDIELLYIPKITSAPDESLFGGTKPKYESEVAIESMLSDGILAKRPSKTGVFTWGPQNKLAIHVASGIPVDFFATDAQKWFVSLVIRTGPKDFNIALINSASRHGYKVHAYGVFERLSDATLIVPQSEREVLELAGLPWIPPEERHRFAIDLGPKGTEER